MVKKFKKFIKNKFSFLDRCNSLQEQIYSLQTHLKCHSELIDRLGKNYFGTLMGQLSYSIPNMILTIENFHLSKSSGGQDMFVANFFDGKRGGFFVEIGGYDGISLSNTYFLEHALDWRGLIVEGNPRYFGELLSNRPNSVIVPSCVSSRKGIVKFYSASDGGGGIVDSYSVKRNVNLQKDHFIDVETRSFESIFKENGVTHVDYLSVDVEGAEKDVIGSIDFGSVEVILMGVELQYMEDLESMVRFMDSLGYGMVTRGVLSIECARDVFFVHREYARKNSIKVYSVYDIRIPSGNSWVVGRNCNCVF